MSREPNIEQLLGAMGREMQVAEAPEARLAQRERVVAGLRNLHGDLVHQRRRRLKRYRAVLLVAAVMAGAGTVLAAAAMKKPLTKVSEMVELRAPVAVGAPVAVRSEPAAVAAPSFREEQAAPVAASAAHADVRKAPASVEEKKAAELAAVNRLFTAAKGARREGRHAEALAFVEELLAKYPRSVLAHEASIEQFRALQRLGRTAEAQRHAAAYLTHYPKGFAREEATRIVGAPSSP